MHLLPFLWQHRKCWPKSPTAKPSMSGASESFPISYCAAIRPFTTRATPISSHKSWKVKRKNKIYIDPVLSAQSVVVDPAVTQSRATDEVRNRRKEKQPYLTLYLPAFLLRRAQKRAPVSNCWALCCVVTKVVWRHQPRQHPGASCSLARTAPILCQPNNNEDDVHTVRGWSSQLTEMCSTCFDKMTVSTLVRLTCVCLIHQLDAILPLHHLCEQWP